MPGIAIRGVCAGDAPAITRLLDGLDAESRYLRWFCGGTDVARAAAWAAEPAAHHAVGLVAMLDAELVGHGVLVLDDAGGGEVAFEVAATRRHHGIASALLRWLEGCAIDRGLHEIYADVLESNGPMLAVLRESHGFTETRDGSVVSFRKELPVDLGASREHGARSAAALTLPAS